MKTFLLRDPSAGGPRRSHPWTSAVSDDAFRYVDLRAMPELIPSVLEDFRPWDDQPAVQAFYRLVAAVNGDASALESNDCAFTGPESTTTPGVRKRLECSGRLGVLFRDLRRNTDPLATHQFGLDLHQGLATLERSFDGGAIGICPLDVDYLALPVGARAGTQTLIWFWAWGDQPPEVFTNLGRVIAALAQVLAAAR